MTLGIICGLPGERHNNVVMLDLKYDSQPLYIAGAAKKTEAAVTDTMNALYTGGMLQLIHKQIKKNEKYSHSYFDPGNDRSL